MEPVPDQSAIEAGFWSEQWTLLLGMTAEAVRAADAVMDAMRGDLGPEFKGKTAVEAAPEVRRRVARWRTARNEIIRYARDAQSDLESAAASDQEQER